MSNINLINDEEFEGEDEQIINDEYKIWKKNSPYLYDLVISNGLEWPSLTVNWLPNIDYPDKSPFCVQKFILGTHTSNNEPNYLMIMKTRLPVDGIPSTSDTKDTTHNSHNTKIDGNRIECETRICHQGEVNRARSMPKKYNIIATKTPSGEVHIFDYFKHPPKPSDTTPRPDCRLLGHTKEGYGINWSVLKEGYLLSGSDDHKICLWDINNSGSTLQAIKVFEEHKSVVEEVSWHRFSEDIFASCGDDRKLILWDLHQDKPTHIIEAHSQEVNSVEFNPLNEFLLLTSSNDKTIALWDIRNLSNKIHVFENHRSDVLSARWNPSIESLFASYSSDRRVNVWDLSKIGKQQSVVDAEDGPAELLFTHGGHTSKITDLDWNPNQELMVATVADDNILHLWEMANTIYYDEDEDEKMRVDN